MSLKDTRTLIAENLKHALTEGFEVAAEPLSDGTGADFVEEPETRMCRPRVIAMCSDGRGVEKLHDMQKFPSYFGCPCCWTRGVHITRWKMIYPGINIFILDSSSTVNLQWSAGIWKLLPMDHWMRPIGSKLNHSCDACRGKDPDLEPCEATCRRSPKDLPPRLRSIRYVPYDSYTFVYYSYTLYTFKLY